MDILLTGFEPFGGSEVNPSEQVALRFQNAVVGGCRVATAILPVDRAKGPAALLDAIRLERPGVVICLGEASGRAALGVERVALNLLDYRIADNAGTIVTDEPVVPGGPAAYFATLPVRAIVEAMRAAGVPCELSLSAGTFLCNQVMYTLLHFAARESAGITGGFIHLPALPVQAAKREKAIPTMPAEVSALAIRAALEVVARGG